MILLPILIILWVRMFQFKKLTVNELPMATESDLHRMRRDSESAFYIMLLISALSLSLLFFSVKQITATYISPGLILTGLIIAALYDLKAERIKRRCRINQSGTNSRYSLYSLTDRIKQRISPSKRHAPVYETRRVNVENRGRSYLELAKTINNLYPDLIALKGLPNALQAALREIGSSLSVSKPRLEHLPVVYARVESASRFSQVYISNENRLFVFDFWARGVCLANGQTPDIIEMAQAINTWIMTDCNTANLAARFHYVLANDVAEYYERGEEVEYRWLSYLRKTPSFPQMRPIVISASRRPQLRQLFPYISYNRLCFSRCTGYPFTTDTPYVQMLLDGRYKVVSASGDDLGCVDEEEAADLVVANLPEGCGPAVPGTADNMTI